MMGDDQDEPWPPVPPDMSSNDMHATEMLENPCQPFIVHQHQLYKSKDGTSVFKMRVGKREYGLHQAAGDYDNTLWERAFKESVERID